ncbi:SAV_2336 N-terminal domain-related protein [Streptomyces sp. NPDC001774]
MLHRIRTVLSGDDELLDAEELLDALWLATRLPPAAATVMARVAAAEPAAAAPARREAVGSTGQPESGPADKDGAEPALPSEGDGSAFPGAGDTALHAAPASPHQQPARSDRAAMAVRTPGMKALGGAELQLGRALRPLKQLRPDALRTELDIDATVTAMAETGLPDAVVRQARTRWLDLAILVDDGVSMLLWQRLAGELRGLMERCGAFRHVRVHGLDTRDPAGPRLRGRPYGAHDAALPMSTVLDPSGNTLLLVLSDGVGRAWRDGSMHQALARAASLGPTAVVHALPQRLWAGTGLDARKWRVTTRRRGAANRTWHIEDPMLPPELAPYVGVPVPVLATDGDVLGTWARLIGSPGDTAVLPLLTLPAFPTPTSTPHASSFPDGPGGAEEAVLRFRERASTDAYRLAAHLAAVAPLPVPVMRLVQHAVTPPVDTSHLAEVFLGGLMHSADAEEHLPHQRTFDFAEETRQILLGLVPPAELVRTTRAVTAFLGELPGSSAGFPAWLPHPEGTDRVRPGARLPFGWVDETLMHRLGISPPDPTSTPPPPPPPSPTDGLREIPFGFDFDPEATGWRRLTVADPRFEGRGALPYDVFAEHDGGWSQIGLFLAHDGEGRILVIRRPDVPHAHDLVYREVTALRRMDNAYAPRLTAWNTGHERPWLAVDCALDGGTEPAPNLRGFARQHGLLHHAGLLTVARQLASGLTRAHGQGLIHGSLTPNSVLIAGREVQIIGWMTASLDRVPSQHRSRHRQNHRYRAPELDRPSAVPTQKADVYALGCILVEAATGVAPDEGLLDALTAARGRLEPGLVHVLRTCLDHDPTRRPDARTLLQALESLAHDQVAGLHPLTGVLGFDSELTPVRLALESAHRGGQGPHLLCRGRPAEVRRDLVRRLLDQLTRQARAGIKLVLADFDGRSGLDRFVASASSRSSFLDLRSDRTGVLVLCGRLMAEIDRRREVLEKETGYHDIGSLEREAVSRSLLRSLPRFVVVIDDFPRIQRLAPEMRTALKRVAECGAQLGIHLILLTDDVDRTESDKAFLELFPTRIDLLSRPARNGGPWVDGAVLHALSLPGPVHFSTGHESHGGRSPGL